MSTIKGRICKLKEKLNCIMFRECYFVLKPAQTCFQVEHIPDACNCEKAHFVSSLSAQSALEQLHLFSSSESLSVDGRISSEN